jgi:hypothetical protein
LNGNAIEAGFLGRSVPLLNRKYQGDIKIFGVNWVISGSIAGPPADGLEASLLIFESHFMIRSQILILAIASSGLCVSATVQSI